MRRTRPPVPVWVSLPCGVQVRIDGRAYPVGVEVRRLGGGEYSVTQKDETTGYVLQVVEEMGYKVDGLKIRDHIWGDG